MEEEQKNTNVEGKECCGGDCSCGEGGCGDEGCGCSHDDSDVGAAQSQMPAGGNPFANMDNETQAKIQELQMLEQNFQQLLQQKHMFSMELSETDMVVSETEKSEGEVFKIVGGQVMIKSTKEGILEDMQNKKELLSKRMEAIDAQEKEFGEKIEEIRAEVLAKIQGPQ